MLWGNEGRLLGIELYEQDPVADRFPTIESLCRWEDYYPLPPPKIVGATRRPGAEYYLLHDYNREVLARMADDDDWPWLVRGMFAVPPVRPVGTYRRQVIHFGASIKDDPQDRSVWDVWLDKFEGLLRRMYWFSARVHLETEFEPSRVFEWLPTKAARDGLFSDTPQPVDTWTRTVLIVGTEGT
jgi:hypothetical protein